MKKLLLLPLILLLMVSCDVVIVEEPVPVVVHTDYRDAFIGFYEVEEYDQTSGAYAEYTFSIAKSGYDAFTIYIDNFYGVGISVIAEVDGNDVFIPEQEIEGFHIEGSGYLDGNELVLNYTVHDHLDGHHGAHAYEAIGWR